MRQDNVLELKKPEPFRDDPISDILRTGARKWLTQVLEAEVEGFLSQNGKDKGKRGQVL